MKNLIFKDSQFEFQTLRVLGSSASGAADIGEVVETAQRIKEGDFKSWCDEWSKTAKSLEESAEESYSKGHFISAKKAYLRAANYYRTAEFYLHENPNNPIIGELYEKSLRCFSYVMKLNKPAIEAVKIPYENTFLPAHYYKLQNSNGKAPVLIAMTGYDGTKEEFYGLAMTALEHGMNFLTFEGPGQGEAVRKQKLFFRYDYEKVVTPVIDYVISRKEVDQAKIILWGESLGGYLAPRAAAFEHRLAACVANSGVYDFFGGILRELGNNSREEFFSAARINPEEFDKNIYSIAKLNSKVRWGIYHGMYVFGVNSPHEYILKAEDFYLKDIAEKIKCPTLVIDSDNDGILGGQSKPLYDVLRCKKEYMFFTSENGAGYHCQVGAKLIGWERILSWIEDIIK
ncbi:dipeptidyl aminopeptidase/acylaminoacyl peptidase [Clostridium acetobutylicum]|uniref:Dipeptidyl aminopeptidase/acylaminoacyl-peptidase related protein n=1 Tax=Clostridium acetobutylicum (strain ATCC 824 / DSM 792 / JCM 1419 / IAM 19013 / LMG 5710 / NBRC 13948 / NRRL B-527 / VKM B-1787 / 2291 / W) TaxID=272562 RepID=Q97DS0_CLOAB|nr:MULTISPECIES: alpha/beta fold hydrolase [Clostridium]AAK81332.1 Dipeptidyl aminopeptidase/acylaminoacyl-peptidase related protein [Clostridium acetobutylicum ATCC 824]ADZ22442.1 Dipeptidyl aminopeptidase/acylaminoacyl-peptidase related protein [Clostridium acetobutylicum EA 2018]AEI32822.1 dipeptidyl aminopeptidase/acylaminoacyl-peptidase related protein [Clostridium acetobutylicum DSM 1731]AWV81001.1 alpha/beta hydrolase [Clostridium acetobutylicum]MBC2395514.1 alpha/beta hydrolase [Clostr